MNLLLATDGSADSEAAVREICARPWPPGSTVTVLSVVCIPFPTEDGETYDIAKADALAREAADRAVRRLREHAPALVAETRIANDLPKRAILDEAERASTDLIFVGSHGVGPLRQFLMGSVSQAVALHAPCSVEIVRSRRPQIGRDSRMRILLAVDGSPCGEAAVRAVCDRPWPPGSETEIVTAVDAFVVPDPYLNDVLIRDVTERRREEASALLHRTAERVRARSADLAVTTEVLRGPAKEAIVDEAERRGTDLIVMGSHGYGPVKRFLVGSVSHAVALYAPCSVEVVRCPEPDVAE